ncbi:PcfJ domain-containing protein [Horticoccus sp. 23ND18S-11]|uniref:PcfJ domain-containing protein n=1 Tax=Horticoccus sp. 23ND18S-11 TaxID=3391832 RepID=UPI0039C95F93
MKQKINGRKVQNWHRPLGVAQLRKGFRQRRYDDPAAASDGRSFNDDALVDAHWDPFDPIKDDDFSWELSEHRLETFLQEILNPPQVWRLEGLGETTADGLLPDPESTTSLEERLRDHATRVLHFSEAGDLLRTKITRAVGAADLEIIKSEGNRFLAGNRFARNVCLFAPFWIRSPRTWKRNSQLTLAEHIFAAHPVPSFLHAEWHRRDVTAKWLHWFILFGQGGSLKRAAKLFQWNIPRKLPIHLGEVPGNLSPLLACIFADVKGLGGAERDFNRIIVNHAFVIDPTECSTPSYDGFWHDTIRWVVAHYDELSDDESGAILEWALHEYTEAERAGLSFSWKARRARPTLARSLEYRRQRTLPYSPSRWMGHGFDWKWEQTPDVWSFVELTTGAELYHEGLEQHHCVASYAARCAAGHSAIVSFRWNDQRRVTIEIDPRSRRVVQCRGPYNREASAEEQSVIGLWVAERLRLRV